MDNTTNSTNSAMEKKALSRVPEDQRQSWYSYQTPEHDIVQSSGPVNEQE